MNSTEARSIINDKVEYDIIYKIFKEINSRELVKSLLMPIPYGVTPLRMADLIHEHCLELLSNNLIKEAPDKNYYNKIALFIFDFFQKNYKGVLEVREFLGNLGRLAGYFETSLTWDWGNGKIRQKYFKTEKKQFTIYTYDKMKEKLMRRSIRLTVTTHLSDKVKAGLSTPANIIHSLDAAIIANLTMYMKTNYNKVPVATVHDCFCTIPAMSGIISHQYLIKRISTVDNPKTFIDNLLYCTFSSYISDSTHSWNKDTFIQLKDSIKKHNLDNNASNMLEKVIKDYNNYWCKIDNTKLYSKIENSWKGSNSINHHGPYTLSF
nr:hypothetical protein [Oedogonium sp. 210]